MAKKINQDTDLFGLQTKKMKDTAKYLAENKSVKDKVEAKSKFTSVNLLPDKEKRYNITITIYPSTEAKIKEMEKAGIKINKSQLYRNAVDTIYLEWQNSK